MQTLDWRDINYKSKVTIQDTRRLCGPIRQKRNVYNLRGHRSSILTGAYNLQENRLTKHVLLVESVVL